MLDLVPITGAWRKVRLDYRDPNFIAEILELRF